MHDKNSNITYISFDHRPAAPDNDFTYDDLNRLTAVEYLDDSQDTESFTMDNLGNRTSAVLRDETSSIATAAAEAMVAILSEISL